MKNSLNEMLNKTKKVEDLKKQVNGLETLMEQASVDAEHYAEIGDKYMEDICAGCYNVYNEARIKMLLKINKLEKEILEFEYRAAISN